jgi:hypothetical protein
MDEGAIARDRRGAPPYVLLALLVLSALHGIFVMVMAGYGLMNAYPEAAAQLPGRSLVGILVQLVEDQGHLRRLVEACLFWFIAAFYLLPLLIAERRRHADIGKIALIDVFLGWSVLGWVASLVWSLLPARGLGRLAEEAGSRQQKKIDLVKARAGQSRETSKETDVFRPRLPYAPPPEGTTSLIKDVEAVRDLEGQVRLVGSSLLPYGMPLRITIAVPGGAVTISAAATIAASGNFVSEPFTSSGRPLPAGEYSISLSAGPFDQSHYTDEIIAAIGAGGTHLPLSATVPDDPEFPQHGRHIDERRSLVFGPIAPETTLIEQVKQAKIKVKDRGFSSKSVEDVIRAHIEATPDFEPVSPAWAVRESEPGTWSVTFKYKRSGKLGFAEWRVDAGSGTVRYADPIAKALSYG